MKPWCMGVTTVGVGGGGGDFASCRPVAFSLALRHSGRYEMFDHQCAVTVRDTRGPRAKGWELERETSSVLQSCRAWMYTKDFWLKSLWGYERKEERKEEDEEGEKKTFGISDSSSTNTPGV